MANGGNVTYLNADIVDYDNLIMHAQSEFELFEVCSRIAKLHDAPYFSVMKFPKNPDATLSSLGIVSNWPAQLISEYDRKGLFHHSPILSHLRNSTEPLVIDIEKINAGRDDKQDKDAIDLFKKYGIYHGVYFSVHDVKGEMAAVSFCGQNPVYTGDTFVRLHYYATLIYSKVSALRSEAQEVSHNLTSNEISFLQMVSEGKTISQISQIVDMSETVINNYLNNCTLKLGCESRIHAVSKALRLKLIK